ncbi:unnamed protein product, partial [marine sediment metagenome]
LTIAQLSATEAGMRVPTLLPPIDQAAGPGQHIGVFVKDGETHGTVHERRGNVDERQIAAFCRERHFDVLFEFVVPQWAKTFLYARMAVVIQK